MKPFLSRWPWRGPIAIESTSKFANRIGSPAEMEHIATRVAERHGLTLADLKGRSQIREIAHPRQEAMAEIWATGRFSSPVTAAFFNRDHTTVLYAKKAVENRAIYQQRRAA